MTEKRDEAQLPHVWIPMSTVDFLAHRSPRSVNVAWVDNHNVTEPTGEGHEYIPISSLESVTRERDAAVMHGKELLSEYVRIGEQRDAALGRVVELETAARTACEWYAKWAETPDRFLWPEVMESIRALEALLNPKEPSDE